MKNKIWDPLRSSNAGQTLFEMVLALGVGILVITAIVKMATLSVKNSTFAKTQSQATRYAQEAIDWLRYQRNLDPLGFATRTNKTWCLQSLAWPGNDGSCSSASLIDNKFKREVYLTPQTVSVGVTVTEAQLTVSWSDSSGTHKSSLTTRLSDNTGSLVINPSSPSPLPPPSNLLTNGGFENGLNNWNTDVSPVGADGAVDPTGSPVHSGSGAAQMSTNPPDIFNQIIVYLWSDTVPIQPDPSPNVFYCVSLWVEKGNKNNSVGLNLYRTGDSTLALPTPASNTTMQNIKLSFNNASGTDAYLKIQLTGSYSPSNPSPTIWVDDVSLTQGACQ